MIGQEKMTHQSPKPPHSSSRAHAYASPGRTLKIRGSPIMRPQRVLPPSAAEKK